MKPTNQLRIFISILFVWLALYGSVESMAFNRSFTIFLSRCSYIENEHEVEPDQEGHRLPTKSIECTISEDGISISGIKVQEILKYEIYDDHKDHLLSTPDQKEFVDFIYLYNGVLLIRFVLEDYYLIGYVNTEE